LGPVVLRNLLRSTPQKTPRVIVEDIALLLFGEGRCVLDDLYRSLDDAGPHHLIRTKHHAAGEAGFVAMVIIGAVPAILLVMAWMMASEARRRDARPILAAIALLLSFAVVLDSIKHVFPPADFEKVAALFEDGGELLSLTILVAMVAVTFRRLSASARAVGKSVERQA
jgi:hypothetical protein